MLVETQNRIVIDGFPDGIEEDVLVELIDPKYANRKHYSRATYASGCRGPLCRLSETHRARVRYQVVAEKSGKPYNFELKGRKLERESELMLIVSWHIWARKHQFMTNHANRNKGPQRASVMDVERARKALELAKENLASALERAERDADFYDLD